MKVRKFEASDMQEALLKVRAELGNEAVILHTKKLTKGGLWGLGGKEMVEVLAATDLNLMDSSPPSTIMPEINEKFKSLQGELKEVKSFIHTLMKQMRKTSPPSFSGYLEDLFLRLLQNEVEEKLAKRLVQSLSTELKEEEKQDSKKMEHLLVSRISSMIGTSSPIKLEDHGCKVVTLIGPTGAGKTTTIAKLAANFMLSEEAKVAFVTADTIRLAAIDQLKRYAEIMGIPVEVAFTPEELKAGINRHTDKDLVLIDTAGTSQKNALRMFELKDFLEVGKPEEIHLVLSATTKYRDILDIIKRFSVVPITSLLFTKLDETNNFGIILNSVVEAGKRLSYITTGQNVPEDIEIPEERKIAQMILEERENA